MKIRLEREKEISFKEHQIQSIEYQKKLQEQLQEAAHKVNMPDPPKMIRTKFRKPTNMWWISVKLKSHFSDESVLRASGIQWGSEIRTSLDQKEVGLHMVQISNVILNLEAQPFKI